jgi:hypothetical protein
MSDAERVRALLARAASVGGTVGQTLVGDALRGILQAVDTTILQRTLSFAAVETGPTQSRAGVLRLTAAERRLVALTGPKPAGIAPDAAAVFDAPLAFDDAETLTRVAQVLVVWVDAVGDAPVQVIETPVGGGAGTGQGVGNGPGIAATALARELGVVVWPDRSLPARLEGWVPVAWGHAQACTGFGVLAGAEMSRGDEAAAAALDEITARLAPGGLPSALAAGLADGGPAGFVALIDGDGRALAIVGSTEAGLAALVAVEDLSALVRAWQQA